LPRWFSIAAIFIITAFVLHAALVIMSVAAGVVSGRGLLTMAGPVTFLVEFALAAVITYFIVRPRGGTPVQMSPEELEQHDAALEADARQRVQAAQQTVRDKQRVEQIKAEVSRWREAHDLRVYAREALDDLGDEDAVTSNGGSLRAELEWALQYADSIDPARDRV
jgi:membrane protein implicated in regulation of membrane protease activity